MPTLTVLPSISMSADCSQPLSVYLLLSSQCETGCHEPPAKRCLPLRSADLLLAVSQSIEDKERGNSLQPGMIPSWAVPAIEGIPEAVQAASKAATQVAKDAVQSVVAAGSSSPTASEKVVCLC